MDNALGGLVVIIGVLILAFFIFRSLLLWYWRVTDIIQQQATQIKLAKEQNDLIKEQNALLRKMLPKQEEEKPLT